MQIIGKHCLIRFLHLRRKIMLTIQEAEYELEKGAEMNFGPWKMHSISVATNAQLIADRINGMVEEKICRFRADWT